MKRENVIFGVVFLVIVVLSILVIWPFVTYIVMAGVLAYTLFPVYSFVRRKIGRPYVSATVSMLVALLVLVLPSFLVAQRLAQEVSTAFLAFEFTNAQRLGDYLSGITGNQFEFQDMLDSAFSEIQTSILDIAPDILGSLTELILGLFIMFFVMFYAFRDGEAFLYHVRRVTPLEPSLKQKLFAEIRNVTQGVLYGQVMTAIVQGSVATLGLVIFGVENWVFWGVIMIPLALLPVFGCALIWVPIAVDLLFAGNTISGVGLLAYGVVVVTNVDNLVRPKLVSDRSKVHPVLVLVGVLGGLKLVGFAGMLVGPLVLALLVALIRFWEEDYLDKTQLAA
jgi:predicted PurR-regulated permease PerM